MLLSVFPLMLVESTINKLKRHLPYTIDSALLKADSQTQGRFGRINEVVSVGSSGKVPVFGERGLTHVCLRNVTDT